MTLPLAQILIYHITDVENLPGILASGGLHSDALMAQRNPSVIGYGHIKQRRMTEIQVNSCNSKFVGEFVPFYFCPRSPMLYAVNRGNTGRPAGCQSTIVHLVSTLKVGIGMNRLWAISDGNAGAFHTAFSSDLAALEMLDWAAIHATQWQGKTHQKSAEFLAADFFEWTGIQLVACYNTTVVQKVQNMLTNYAHRPDVRMESNWYY